MPVAARSGTTFVRVERRFDVVEAHRLRDAITLFAPVNHVSIDFSGAGAIDDTALPVLAQVLLSHPDSRFSLYGLTHHHRRLLRYMGVPGHRVAEAGAIAPGAAASW
jgi:anti-anti-sigma regulatory factor